MEKQLSKGTFEIILSHTCPYKYEPTDMFIPGLDQSQIDKSTEEWLDMIEDKYPYSAWFCGHWHTDRLVGKLHFLYDTWETTDNLL